MFKRDPVMAVGLNYVILYQVFQIVDIRPIRRFIEVYPVAIGMKIAAGDGVVARSVKTESGVVIMKFTGLYGAIIRETNFDSGILKAGSAVSDSEGFDEYIIGLDQDNIACSRTIDNGVIPVLANQADRHLNGHILIVYVVCDHYRVARIAGIDPPLDRGIIIRNIYNSCRCS
jgi:hypothetical protein